MDAQPVAQHPGVRPWLVLVAASFALLVLIGGVVRVTRSGLSITEWSPVAGALPPLSDADWAIAYAKYRETPEARAFHTHMALDAFKHIYWLEWIHRFVARAIGIVVLVPMAFFAWRRGLPRRLALSLGGIAVLVLAQAVLGWLMVKSGLVRDPHVSPYRLTAHFVLGLCIYAWSVALAVRARGERLSAPGPSRNARRAAHAAVGTVALTMAWGALTAGHHAGLACHTFPTMFGEWIPRGVFDATLGPDRLVAVPILVQFMHRALALGTLLASAAAALWHWRSGEANGARSAYALLGAVLLQGTLGAFVVLHHVPAWAAWLHQAGGLAVFTLAWWRVLRLTAGLTPNAVRARGP